MKWTTIIIVKLPPAFALYTCFNWCKS